MVDLCPKGHKKYTQILNNLAVAFSARYDLEGDISDLNRANEIGQKRLDLCPLGHLEHAPALGHLASFLWRSYQIRRKEADLDKIIEMDQKRLDLCPPGHPTHAKALGNLAASLEIRYHLQGNMADMHRAIRMARKRLDLSPLAVNHQQHLEALGNLAVYLHARYLKQGNLADLSNAIELQEKHLALCPSRHPDHARALESLAWSLRNQSQVNVVKNHSDLTRAIKFFKEALASYPVQHHRFSVVVHGLATTILLLLGSSDQPILSPHYREAFSTYRLLKACGPAVSVDLWNTVQAWIKDAEEYNHPSLLEAYQTSLNTLDHIATMHSSVDSRYEAMQARVADLADNAFSCALKYDNLQMAVELLEQGRGILWNQLARFDARLPRLSNALAAGEACELGNSFTRLSACLRKHVDGSVDKGIDPYWRVNGEWLSVVDRIRCQDGFSRFLLPPVFDDLQQAAECGPVIVVNASKYACDALIILPTQPPIHVPLQDSLGDPTQLCFQFSELIQNPYAYGEHRESWVKQSLRDLWTSVVHPIVTILQNVVQLPIGARIWWCPTSKFTILPFHAAGPYRKNEKNLMDIYISSYAPSLSALIRARERVRSQKQIRDASGINPNTLSFAVVGQAQPDADLKLSELREVESEIWKIRNETGMPPDVSFKVITDDAATIEGAVQAFRDHRWVHLACHGAQHPTKPFQSWFAMRDGPLTLMRIIRERYTHSEFAFLSACRTAVGDKSAPDEVLHLAAGMHFTGFNGVIGTLWKVDDSATHQMVTRFYREMFKHPDIGFEHAAAALNVAVLESENEVPLEKRIVFVHIGI